MSRARHKEHEKHERAKGGRVGLKAAGNPDVFAEAEGKENYDKGDERKRGGKVKKKEMHAEGEKGKHRMDRPRRARGGGIGADRNPLSSAHHGGKGAGSTGGEPD